MVLDVAKWYDKLRRLKVFDSSRERARAAVFSQQAVTRWDVGSACELKDPLDDIVPRDRFMRAQRPGRRPSTVSSAPARGQLPTCACSSSNIGGIPKAAGALQQGTIQQIFTLLKALSGRGLRRRSTCKRRRTPTGGTGREPVCNQAPLETATQASQPGTGLFNCGSWCAKLPATLQVEGP